MSKDKNTNFQTDDNDSEMNTAYYEVETDDEDEMSIEHKIEFTKLPTDKDGLRRNPFGFAGKDLAELLNSITANNSIFFYRPINENAGDKIDLGTHAGKGIDIKGKSSNFGPIAGEIPLNPRLSKLFGKEEAKEEYESFYAQLLSQLWKNKDEEEALKLAAEIHDEKASEEFIKNALLKAPNGIRFCKAIKKTVRIREDHKITPVAREGFKHKISYKYRISYDEKEEAQEYDLYYFRKKGDDNPENIDVTTEILSTNKEHKRPVFAIKVNGKFFFLNQKGDTFIARKEQQEDVEKFEFEATHVEVLAYIEPSFDSQNKKVIFSPKIITADYDDLVSSGQKIMPLANGETFLVDITRELFMEDALSASELKAHILASHEINKNIEFTDRSYFPDLGSVTTPERDYKSVQKADTNASTNHGPEIGNPNPEPFSDDEAYPVVIANVQIKNYVARKLVEAFPEENDFSFSEFGENKGFALKLHGEKQIIFLFNLLRKVGYPIRTNPKWNWVLGGEESSKFLIDPFDENREYVLDSGNQPKFRPLVIRAEKIDWQEITKILKEEKESYKKSKNDLVEKIIDKFISSKDVKEEEISEFNENLSKLFESFETKMTNYVVKFRSHMKDLPVVESGKNTNTTAILKKIFGISDDNDGKNTVIGKLTEEFRKIAPKFVDVEDITDLFTAFYIFNLNEKIQNQMLMISGLESDPSITYAWGNFIYTPAFESDKEYIKLIKDLGNEMSNADKKKADKILELGIQTGIVFEEWRKKQIAKLKAGLDDGVETFKGLTRKNTQLAQYAQLILENEAVIEENTGKLLDRQSSTDNSSQRAASSNQRAR